jgi:hypothetical protein
MTHQQYLDTFNGFAASAIEYNKPTGNPALHPILRMQSFLEDFGDKLKKLNDVLVDKGNEFLTEASNDNSIDTAKLKTEIYELADQSIQTFISKYKPK